MGYFSVRVCKSFGAQIQIVWITKGNLGFIAKVRKFGAGLCSPKAAVQQNTSDCKRRQKLVA